MIRAMNPVLVPVRSLEVLHSTLRAHAEYVCCGSVGSVLDVGCGIRPSVALGARKWTGLEAHRPYCEKLAGGSVWSVATSVIEASSMVGPGIPHGAVVCHDARLGIPFGRGTFDFVWASDFIEHLSREDGLLFLAEASRVSRFGTFVLTPLGFLEQEHKGDLDPWGMDGGAWQSHLSGWEPSDLGCSNAWVVRGMVTATWHEGRRVPLAVPRDWFAGFVPSSSGVS